MLGIPLCSWENKTPLFFQMTIEMYPSDQVADLRAEVTHWYENLQKEQINQQAQLQEFGQSSRKGDFPGELFLPGDFAFITSMIVGFFFFPRYRS